MRWATPAAGLQGKASSRRPGCGALFGRRPHAASIEGNGSVGIVSSHMADVSWLPALFVRHPDWQVSLDQDPTMAVETRKRIFDRAIVDKLAVAGTHWLLPNIGTIAKDGSGYAFTPIAG